MKQKIYSAVKYNNNYRSVLGRSIKGIALAALLTFAGQQTMAQVVVSGSVFAGGNAANITGSTEVTLQGSAHVIQSVYGGGALADVSANTVVNIEGGTVDNSVFGGGRGSKTTTGSGNSYEVTDSTAALVGGNVTVNIGQSGDETTSAGNGVTIGGSVFGGNDLCGGASGNVTVHIYGTSHTLSNTAIPTASIDGLADTTGVADTNYALQAVYGGGNLAHYNPDPASKRRAYVHVHGCFNTIKYLYGGGNAANTPADSVIIEGGRFYKIFGGGNGENPDLPGANVTQGNAYTLVKGGVLTYIFGGSNTKGDIAGNVDLNVDQSLGSCGLEIVGNLYGGGNLAPGKGGNLTVECGDIVLGNVYGGANAAYVNGDVTLTMKGGTGVEYVFGGSRSVDLGDHVDGYAINGDVTLNLYGGTFVNAFGGSDASGNIKGNINVNVADAGNQDCPLKVTNVYGGGKDAPYTPQAANRDNSPMVFVQNVKSHASAVDPYNKVMNNVFGGGYGEDAVVTANPVVYIGDTNLTSANLAIVGNNVYGGGELASVDGNTSVTVRKSNTEVENTVYGAGKGDTILPNAAIVLGNATVTIDDGNVHHSIYGGGELSSVGTFTLHPSTVPDESPILANGHVKGEPASAAAGTGITKVVINGGLIGLRNGNNRMPDPSRPTSEDDYGYIFCAGKGMADPRIVDGEGVPYANRLAVVDSTYLEINGGLITASVYGGSENGEVLRHTHVKITGGQIGVGYNQKNNKWDSIYTESQWTPVLAKVREGNFEDSDTTGFHFCDAWPFNAEGTRYTYDFFATYYNDSDSLYYYDVNFTQPSYNGSNRAGDGHSYFGHVFGGGSGYYPYAPGLWRRSAGRVIGNTKVEIIGGHILTNIYGGNEITDVLGSTKVEMTGGTLGVPRCTDSILARPVNCNLFGAGMGDPRIIFNQWSNVASTEVIVGGDAVIFGSVFGGGEDGHVLGDASTTIKDSAVIGTTGGSGLDGNVYGGGRGFSTWALTAGVVSGNVELTIQDSAKIHGSIYGGGRLAAVGTFLVDTTSADYGTLQLGAGHGNITINITGGTVGNSHKMGRGDYSIGDVFGGSKGTLGLDVARNQRLGLAKNTTINISETDSTTTHILGNVYGGGEIASVGRYHYATADSVDTFLVKYPSESMAVGDVYSIKSGEAAGKAIINISGGTIGTAAPIFTDSAQLRAFTHREPGNTLYKKGFVFGGCLGMADIKYSGYSFVTNSQVTISDSAWVMASVFGGGENGHVFNSTDVRIQGGQVGMEMDSVEHMEDANGVGVVEDIFFGNVYGGGRGIDTYRDNDSNLVHSITAGRVRNATKVTMTGGRVTHNIYGGGSLATVGYKDDTTSGTATVTIRGGIVGFDDGHTTFDDNGVYYYDGTPYDNLGNAQKNAVKHFYLMAGNNEGNVYGSGRGHAGQNTSDQYVSMAFVKNTVVTLADSAQMRGSLFGGGENGHVRKNTLVVIADSAQIGVPLMSAVDWDMAQWRVEPDGYIAHDTLSNGISSTQYYHNEPYGTGMHLHEHWIGDNGEGPTIYRGNVYGGGRGVTPIDNKDTTIDAHEYSATAGRVYGNATVEINGGHIYHDVFGGGSLASVGTLVYKIDTVNGHRRYLDPMGNVIDTVKYPYRFLRSKTSSTAGWTDTTLDKTYTRSYYRDDPVTGTGLATVIVRGGIVGTDGINEGGVFGSGRGIAGARTSRVAHLANANNTKVYIYGAHGTDDSNTVAGTTGADIRSTVFGGGANGHVLENTQVRMTGGKVGVPLPLAVRKIDERTGHGYRNYSGNVYGGGRGVSVVASSVTDTTEHLSETAGRVFGNTHVVVSGGNVYHSVFGGGSLASVGTFSYKLWNDGDTHRYRHLFVQGTGQAVVHITGDAHIGHPAEELEKPISGYTAADALTAQYVLRTFVDTVNWNGDSAWAASKWAGLNDNEKRQLFTELNYHYLGSNSGMVFGSGRGVGALHDGTVDKDYINSAFTRNTIVIVDSTAGKNPVIGGSVFGGGENGHVKINTHVAVKGGIIGGIPLHDTSFCPSNPAHNGIDGDSTYHFSDSTGLVLRLEFEDNEDNAGHGPAVYRGNVYGGGRGVDHTDAESPETGYSATAGRVYGNVEVEVTGGMIYHHVFGGGSLASVGTYLTYNDGIPYRVDTLFEYKLVPYSTANTANIDTSRIDGKYAPRRAGFRTDGSEPDTQYVMVHAFPGAVTVNVSGGQVGVTGVNEGSVFGGGRGIAGRSSDVVTHLAYCSKTDVNILPGAVVRGSVFGGGANGHVLTDAHVTMTGGIVGDTLSSEEREINSFGEANIKVFHGNVYGGGRGVDPISSDAGHNLSYTAGRVYGDATVDISGGTVRHNVYGGGSLATVGTILYRKSGSDPAPGTSLAPTAYDTIGTTIDSTGRTWVTISDSAVIGSDGMNNGSVFGSCRGVAGPGYSDRAYVYNTFVTIDGGTIHGSVFGSGENGHVQNNTVVVINDGTIGTDISSIFDAIDAGAGTDSAKAAEKKKYDYIGNVYGAGRGVDVYKDKSAKDAYSYSAGYVRNTTNVTVNGGTIYRNVYGGGSMGLVGDYGIYGDEDDWQGRDTNGTATVNINASVGTSDNVAKGYGGCVFGSSRGQANDPADPNHHDFADMAYVHKTKVNIGNDAGDLGLTVYGNVYGGGESGHVDWGGTVVNIKSGNIKGNVFGGGMGSSTSPTAGIVDGNTQVNIGLNSQDSNNVVIEGLVFGGNDAGSSPLGIMRVDVWKTAHPGSTAFPTLSNAQDTANCLTEAVASNSSYYALTGVYGGGNQASALTGDPAVDAPTWTGAAASYLNKKYIELRLFPAENSNPAWGHDTTRTSTVYLHGCENTVKYVYGGGRAANTRTNVVTIEGGRVYQAFAGGNGDPTEVDGNPGADVLGDASLTINGGIVYQAFGGSNTKGMVNGSSSVNILPQGSCALIQGEVYGGGNNAPGGAVEVVIPCSDKHMPTIFGGARNADIGTPDANKDIILTIHGSNIDHVFGGNNQGGTIYGNVTVNIHGGTLGEVFGGCNEGGNITGNITVNVIDSNSLECPLDLDYVYGGGNLISYTPDSTGGSGPGSRTDAVSNPSRVSPVVNIIQGTVNFDVFGGGKGDSTHDAQVKANPHVNVGLYNDKEVNVGRNVYGGGNAASVDGNTYVNIRGNRTQVAGNVYGGGNAANVSGTTDVQVGGTVRD